MDPYSQIKGFIAGLGPDCWYAECKCASRETGMEAAGKAGRLDSGTSSAGVSWWSAEDRTLLTIAGRVLMAAGPFNPQERAGIRAVVREVGGEFSQARPPGGEFVESEAALEQAERNRVEARPSRPWWKIWA